jgi:divalent metal cation (Fe/Co/Zn/Cd) transporter
MMLQMSRRRPDSAREWLSGLAIIVTALVCLFGFWRLSPGATFIIAAIAFVALIALMWRAGGDATEPSDQ